MDTCIYSYYLEIKIITISQKLKVRIFSWSIKVTGYLSAINCIVVTVFLRTLKIRLTFQVEMHDFVY